MFVVEYFRNGSATTSRSDLKIIHKYAIRLMAMAWVGTIIQRR